jgi:predicted enzyme related to lactoylglutathione lyase
MREVVINMLNFNSILVFSEDPGKLADFYKKVFQKDPDMDDGGYFGFLVGKGFITIGPHDKVHGKNTNPERIMINFETEDVKGEFERIEKLGAKVIAKPYSPMEDTGALIATFEDPDGNIFQLTTPWDEGMKN